MSWVVTGRTHLPALFLACTPAGLGSFPCLRHQQLVHLFMELNFLIMPQFSDHGRWVFYDASLSQAFHVLAFAVTANTPAPQLGLALVACPLLWIG